MTSIKHSKKTKIARSRKIPTIEEADPAMMVDLIAESVIQDAQTILQELRLPSPTRSRLNAYLTSPSAVEFLTNYAERVYSHNERFRRGVNSNANQGNAGRDYLVNFMSHWLSCEIAKITNNNYDIHRALERSGFSWYGYDRNMPRHRH